MADDEQFSLCWNNFNSNLSAGFHESLCRGDLVDVTLAAEGQFVKAHRLVLSVCSPYFRKMFTQMPANQHAFVFLKDVSHTALKDLIQFMYCGEVNVKQEALPAFISTAEALQIKGLTDSDPAPSQSPAEPSTPTPQLQQVASPRVRQRTSATRAYKIETVDDSVDDSSKPTTQIVIQTTAAPVPQTTTIAQQQQQQQQTQHLQQTQSHNPPPPQQQQQQVAVASAATTTTTVVHKRPARSIGSGPHVKRTKSTIDPLDTTESAHAHSHSHTAPQQITVQTAVVTDSKPPQQQQQQTETEYIDLPIELPTKSEPDYAEEAGEVDSGEHETTYVEDDSYGDLRYDESYFTENEDAANAGATTVTQTTGGSGAGGNTSGASATTSKAIVKQQSFTDSSYVESADQTNNEAQERSLAPLTEVRKRGRPKQKKDDEKESLVEKLQSAIMRNADRSRPCVYASTTKGGMKLLYEGHHFRYSFRKGQYSIFQCCYKENREECKVRIVSDQKRVYPLDGEHVHFVQATDKSVTAHSFEASGEDAQITCTEDKTTRAEYEVEDEDQIEQRIKELAEFQEEFIAEAIADPEPEPEPEDTSEPATVSFVVDPNDFREKIKKRLQKALLGKKK